MKILAEDLARLCYNAIQFSSKDSSLGGVVMFHLRPTENPKAAQALDVYASDDYVAMRDVAAAYPQDAGEIPFYLGLKELKELEKWLRDVEGIVEIDLNGADGVEATSTLSSLPLQIVSEPPDFSAVLEVVHSEPNPFTGEYSPSAEPFAIRAERFTKFRLLRTPESPSCKDGYPVDFLWDGQIIRWKCGPFLKGVVGPLVRHSYVAAGVEVTGIKDLYAEESEVLW